MGTVYGFNHEKDVNRVLTMLDNFERSKGKSVISPSSVRQEARYAKVLTLIDDSEGEDAGKEATAIEVAWVKDGFGFIEVSDNPVKYDNDLLEGEEATVFSTNNIVSQSAMAVDDIVLLQKYPGIKENAGWLVVEATGGGSRSYIEITSVTDAANYIGIVLNNPIDLETIKSGVAISVPGAITNEFQVGYRDFADLSNGIYYPDGTLLG